MPDYATGDEVNKHVKKQMGELLSVDTLSDVDFRRYAANVKNYSDYNIYFNNIPRSMEFIMNLTRYIAQRTP